MQAILLAGGLGTRLRSVVDDRPKPMAPIEGKPFMEYLLHELTKYGIREIIFAIGYKGSMVEEYFGDGSTFHIAVSYAYEEELLGTAGAIKNAGRFITGDEFLVMNADTFYQINYERLFEIKKAKKLELALVLREVSEVSRYGRAVLNDGYLTGFNEKTTQAGRGTINGGIYLMDRELLADIPDGIVSLEHEMIPRWLREKRRLGGIVNDGYFIDIGIPESYYQFMDDVKKGVVRW